MEFKDDFGRNSWSAAASFAITKHDTTDFAFYVRGIYVGGAGDVVVVNPDGSTCTFVGVPAGTILPVKARRVNSTSTTATSMVGLY
jgi:hypothetical protein